jgi:methionine synthase II (cobalamin-independent)
MSFKPHCIATGIGSVPHTDPEKAVEFVLSYFPEAPYWPQLPKRAATEGLLNQFSAPLAETGLVAVKGDKFFFDTDQTEWGAKLAGFYETYLAAVEGDEEALSFFKFPYESAAGFYAFIKHLELKGTGQARYLKGQISGPLTVGLALTDQDRKAIYYNPQCRDVLIKTLALQGMNQARELAKFGLPVMVFVDEPGLYASGQSIFITLKKDEIISELNSIYEAIQGTGALAGTHSCAGMDWSILFESTVDIISFDAFEYFDSIACYSGEMKAFIDRGGCLAWGIVPTSAEKIKQVSADILKSRLDENITHLKGKDINPSALLEQAIITPSCGTGTLTMEMAVRIHELTRDLAGIIRAI